MKKKQSEWLKHVKKTYKEMKKEDSSIKLGDAMVRAKETYKK